MDTNIPHVLNQAGDPAVISAIVGQLKSQGIFDEFRRGCIADVDTKPAYQNLRQRVEIYVSKFLSQQTWCTDLNKNQLRDTLRRSINESGVLAWGIDHLVEQIVTPKIYHVFYPQIEAVVKEYLGFENRHCIPNLSVPPPGMNETQERSFEPPEPKEEAKPGKESQQFTDGSMAATVSSSGINEQVSAGEKAQTFMNTFSKTSGEVLDKISVKLEEKEKPKSPSDVRDGSIENTNLLKIKSEPPDSADVSSKISSESKDEQKKINVEKKLEQDNSVATEKSKNAKEKDKESKIKRERTSSECSDRDKNASERKDHSKGITHKKTGSDPAKIDRERKLDKQKIVEKEKLKSDSGKTKDGKKHESERGEKKLAQKVDAGKSSSDSLKLKHAKSTDSYKKSHKSDGSSSKSSSHSTESLKSHKPDRTKADPNTKLQKASDHKSSKLEKTDKSKITKSDSKGKVDQESNKPKHDSKQKSSAEFSSKPNKHSSENKVKHSDSKIKSHGSQEKSISKQTIERKSHSSSSSQKPECSDKVRHTTSDKKHYERSKSAELSEDSSKSEYPEAKRIKLDPTSTSGHKKLDKHSSSHSHAKHSVEKERKSESSKDRSKTHSDKQKTSSKPSEKPKSSHQEKSPADVLNKTDRDKSTERKSSSAEKTKPLTSSDKQKQSSSSNDKHKKAEEYRHSKDKEKRKEKLREMKREKSKSAKEENSRTSSEGSSTSKDDTVKAKQTDVDHSQKWKMQSQESLDSKDCQKQSPCCNFSPEACSESESHSSKGSDILLNIRPVLGISPSQESFYENNDNSERSKPTSEVLSLPKELNRLVEDQARTSSDEYEDTSKITQDGKDGCLIRLLNDDIEDGAWSDVTISSVHTSDLSSFDDRISLSSSEEEVEEENSQKEKKKVPLKEIKKLTESQGSDDKDHGDTSVSEDEKAKHKLEKSRKRMSSEKSSNFSRCFEIIGGKKDEPTTEPKVEHKWELRRQRKINPRYASDEFSSIFNSNKWSYSNNLDIGDSNANEPTDNKVPARKSSHGSRSDLSQHGDCDNGTSRTSNFDKYETDESGHKRKRSRLKSSSSEQGEKGPSAKRQKHKEETKFEIKEPSSDNKSEKGITDDSEIKVRYRKRTNIRSPVEKSNSPPRKRDACHPESSTSNIQPGKNVPNVAIEAPSIEDNSAVRSKPNEVVNLKPLGDNHSSINIDGTSHLNPIATDVQSEEVTFKKTEKSTDVTDECNKSVDEKTVEERNNSQKVDHIQQSTASPSDIQSEDKQKWEGSLKSEDVSSCTIPSADIQSENSTERVQKNIEIIDASVTEDSEIKDKPNTAANLGSTEETNNSAPLKSDTCHPVPNIDIESKSDKCNVVTDLKSPEEEISSPHQDDPYNPVASLSDFKLDQSKQNDVKETASAIDDTENEDRCNKRTNSESLDGEDNSSQHQRDANCPFISTADIQSEDTINMREATNVATNSEITDKCKERTIVKSLEDDENSLPCKNTSEIQSESVQLSAEVKKCTPSQTVSQESDSEIETKQGTEVQNEMSEEICTESAKP